MSKLIELKKECIKESEKVIEELLPGQEYLFRDFQDDDLYYLVDIELSKDFYITAQFDIEKTEGYAFQLMKDHRVLLRLNNKTMIKNAIKYKDEILKLYNKLNEEGKE